MFGSLLVSEGLKYINPFVFVLVFAFETPDSLNPQGKEDVFVTKVTTSLQAQESPSKGDSR